MRNYLDLMSYVLSSGEQRNDRTGTGTLAIFGTYLEFDLREGFPAVTTKKLAFKSVAAELAGFLEGTTSAKRMRELGTKIWDANANAGYWQSNKYCNGPDDMGRVYGAQWRSWTNFYDWNIDQLAAAVKLITNDPTSRRIMVSAWNPGEQKQMCLPPCHYAFQFYVSNDGHLDILVHMRSVDMFLGMPFDIASYALLLHIVANQTNKVPRMLKMTFGDTHIYKNHQNQVLEQLSRIPFELPMLDLDTTATIDNFHPSMAELIDYEYHASIKADMSI